MLVLAAAAGVAFACSGQAADRVVIASNGVKAALEELGPHFEHASSNKVSFQYGVAAVPKINQEKPTALRLTA